MLRTVVAGLRARPLRLLLSAVAIALGVAFVAGSLIVSDAVGAGLRQTVAYETRGVDASLSAERGGAELDDALLAKVRRVPGVAAAEGRVTASTPLRDTSGRPADAGAVALPADGRLRPFDLADGRFPRTANEVAMERNAAADRELGTSVTVFDRDGHAHAFTLVGTFSRPTEAGIGAADLVLPPESLRRLAPGEGYVTIVARAGPGIGQERLAADLRRAVGDRGVTVVTGREAATEMLVTTAPDGTGPAKFVAAFAVLAMVVAAMVIANSFTILIAQRARELALLRCIGARKRQVFAGVLGEALAVGVVASVAGLLAGFGVAAALQSIAGAVSGHEVMVHVPLTGRTVFTSLAVGVLVTGLAAVIPARAATRVAPVDALRQPLEGGAPTRTAGRVRKTAAVVLPAGGITAAVLALSAEMADGAVLSVVAMVVLLGAVLAAGPVVVGPFVRVLGTIWAPVLGRPAKLAALNAGHNSRRTAATAAALTIGLCVVSLVTTVTAGVEAGQDRAVDQQVAADFTVTSVAATRNLPASVADTLATVPGVADVALRRSFAGDLGPLGVYEMTAIPGDALGSLLRPTVLSGRLDRLGPGDLAVSRQLAEDTGVAVGDTVRAGPADKPVPLRVVAVVDGVSAPGTDLGLALVDAGRMAALTYDGSASHDHSVLVRADADADRGEVRQRMEQALSAEPLTRVSDAAELKDELSAPLRSTLSLLWALTALAVLIAFAGIANTLSLSVLERTRESALLRALGLTRGGLGATLMAESLFIALFGAACGLGLGVGTAWLITEVASTGAEPVLFAPPWAQLATLLGAAVLAAPLAAVTPALRAARTPPSAALAST